jgi:hypothetical protein
MNPYLAYLLAAIEAPVTGVFTTILADPKLAPTTGRRSNQYWWG